mmetsp:Transcript_12104/g.36412  ORF Transcript_12104/g.36412 Transcript_12104/m.36412 type:complete len:373 (-) Transcript_12104:1694-2812(-)
MYDVADGGGADGIVDGGYSEVHLPSTYTKHTLTALEPGAVYRMQLFACTSAGDGVHTDIVTATTLGGAVRRWGSGPRPMARLAADGMAAQESTSSENINGRQQPAIPDVVKRSHSAFKSTVQPDTDVLIAASTRSRRFAGFSPTKSTTTAAAAAAAPENPRSGATTAPSELPCDRGHIPRRKTVTLEHWQRKRHEALSSKDTAVQHEGADSTLALADAQTGDQHIKCQRGFVNYSSDSGIAFGHQKNELYSAKPLTTGIGASESRSKVDKGAVVLKDGMYVGKYDGGTIRGKKNSVRKSLQVIAGAGAIEDDVLRALHESEHRNKIVVYTTTLSAVRSTISACSTVMKLFTALRLKVQVMRAMLLQCLAPRV